MRSARWRVIAGLALIAGGAPCLAQSVISVQSGLIHYIEGSVFRNDKPLVMPPGRFEQMQEQDTLRTASGRAEVLLSPGVFLRAAEDSAFRLLSKDITAGSIEHLAGSIVLEVAEIDKRNKMTVLHGDVAVALAKSGVYRFDFEPASLRVFEGEAVVSVEPEGPSRTR